MEMSPNDLEIVRCALQLLLNKTENAGQQDMIRELLKRVRGG